MKVRKKKAEPKRGRPARYDESLSMTFAVRLDEDQATAIERWCTAQNVSPAMLLREATLQRVGITGIGLQPGTADREVRLGRPCNLPVKVTPAQHAAIVRAAMAQSIPPSVLLRECALAAIGRSDLGAAKQLKHIETFMRGMR
jgi:hypothetical protein